MIEIERQRLKTVCASFYKFYYTTIRLKINKQNY